MTDMSAFAKKTTPGQDSHRRQWILDTVRNNQIEVADFIHLLVEEPNIIFAKEALEDMHKQDRDALLQKNGILTDAQIEVLQS